MHSLEYEYRVGNKLLPVLQLFMNSPLPPLGARKEPEGTAPIPHWLGQSGTAFQKFCASQTIVFSPPIPFLITF